MVITCPDNLRLPGTRNATPVTLAQSSHASLEVIDIDYVWPRNFRTFLLGRTGDRIAINVGL